MSATRECRIRREWSPTRLDWFVDGVLRFSSSENTPGEPFYIILNTAVGGDWPGNPDGSTIFPQYHEIDYVRVYVPADSGVPAVNLVDTTPGTAVADGVIGASEYATMANGRWRIAIRPFAGSGRYRKMPI